MADFVDRLESVMAEDGLEQVDLAARTGVMQSTISRIIRRRAVASPKMKGKLARGMGIEPHWMITAEGPKYIDGREVPLLGAIPAGPPLSPTGESLGMEIVPSNIRRRKPNYALQVNGDSMVEFGIQDGDLVFIRQQPTADSGDIAAILVDGEATLKQYVKPQSGTVVLKPGNKRLKSQTFMGPDLVRIEVIGLCVGKALAAGKNTDP